MAKNEKRGKAESIAHPILPAIFHDSRILILGTMPSPKSREDGFYYAHPQNRFWPVLAGILGERLPVNKEEKLEMLKKHHIALWDVLKSCDICGASDSSIKNPVPNDISGIIKNSEICAVYTTGAAAYRYYCRYCEKAAGIKAVPLPSTSPANARM